MSDRFYRSRFWLALREQALKRDNWLCVIPGCGLRAVVVDHIISRKRGGPDALHNLRALCRLHDNQAKEDATGKRRGRVDPSVRGCDRDGIPNDPRHPWRQQ